MAQFSPFHRRRSVLHNRLADQQTRRSHSVQVTQVGRIGLRDSVRRHVSLGVLPELSRRDADVDWVGNRHLVAGRRSVCHFHDGQPAATSIRDSPLVPGRVCRLPEVAACCLAVPFVNSEAAMGRAMRSYHRTLNERLRDSRIRQPGEQTRRSPNCSY